MVGLGGQRIGGQRHSLLSPGLYGAWNFTDHVVLRGEVRYDKANQPILTRRATLSDKQTTAGVNFIILY
jgi:hypothetical protein